MNGDIIEQSQLDSFSLLLPLPYRIAIILVLGMKLCVPSNVHTEANDEEVFGLGLAISMLSQL